ncbi:MAG: succinate dehydrogenase cytochrome b subunit [Opitutales bacterium]
MTALSNFINSTIGRKILMALTGIVLVLFVLGHMLGNLQIFLGADVINAYAYKLHYVLPTAALWAIRLFLLAAVGIHIWAAVMLTLDNRKARPENYAKDSVVQATYASRTMRMSGVILLAFIIFHLAHYTARVVPGKEYDKQIVGTLEGEAYSAPVMVPLVKGGEQAIKNGKPVQTFNVNDMMVAGFQVWWVSGFYILATGLLCMHLSHGVSSMFQTLGLRNKDWRKRLDVFAVAYGWIVFLGFAIIPLAVMGGFVKMDPSGGLEAPVASISDTFNP